MKHSRWRRWPFLEAMRNGRREMDFADALHLATSKGYELFATFDRKFVRRPAQLELKPATVDAGAKT